MSGTDRHRDRQTGRQTQRERQSETETDKDTLRKDDLTTWAGQKQRGDERREGGGGGVEDITIETNNSPISASPSHCHALPLLDPVPSPLPTPGLVKSSSTFRKVLRRTVLIIREAL